MSERRLFRSLEFKSRGGILRFKVETILLTFSAFLHTLRQCSARYTNEIHPRVQQNSIVCRPNVLKYKLHKQRLQRAATEVLVADDPFCLRVEVKVAPEHPLEVNFLDTKLDREYLRKLGDAEPPAAQRRRKYDVSPLRSKVNVLIVFLVERLGSFVVVVQERIRLLRQRIRLLRQRILLARKPTLALLAPPEIVLHALTGKEAAHDRVRLLDELRQMVIRLHRRLLELRHKPIQLVNDEDGPQAVDPRLAQHGHRLGEGGKDEVRAIGSPETVDENQEFRTCEETPSTTSTRTRAPSTRRDAVDTSLEKSTCPGVSIMFIT